MMVRPCFRPSAVRVLAALILVIMAESHCTRREGTAGSDAQTLTVGYFGDEYFFAPGNDDYTKHFMFLPLAMWDSGCRTGEPTGLAERWEHTGDRREWTFHLRQGLRWHDGVPVTAHDIAFNVALFKHPEVQWYGAWYADSARAVDDSTVTFFLRQPGTLSNFTWDVYYPKHLIENLEPSGFYDWDFWKQPVGNGPYRYARHDPETHVELEANPDYYRGEPPITRLRVLFGNDESNLLNLLAGRVDIIHTSAQDAERFLVDDGFTVHYADLNTAAGVRLVWNLESPLFEDKAVRQALTMAIDRRGLGRALGLPADAPITEGTYNSCLIERGEVLPPRPFDPEAATRLLETAGWRDTDGDGVRERGGVPFRFEAIVVSDYQRAAVFAQEALRRIGIRMDVRVMEYETTLQRFNTGEFEAALPRIPRLDARFGAAEACGETASVPCRPNGYDNPRVRDLWTRLGVEDDPDEIVRLHKEISAIYHDEIPGTFLYSRVRATVARSRVRGLDRLVNWLAFPDRLSIEPES